MRITMSLGLLGTVIAVGSLAWAGTTPATSRPIPECPQQTPSGFFWRYEDVPQELKRSVEVCWTYAVVTATAPRPRKPSTLFEETLRRRGLK